MRQEKRLHPRYPVAWGLKGRVLSALEPAGTAAAPIEPDIRGEVTNIGGGGLCLLTRHRTEPATALRCEIFAPHVPVGIPTLLQVRWLDKDADGYLYRLGLQFVV